jgi:ectoine hydroxylase-related dioxygenase (phytanoyl-CoA dioxygenase family)
MYFLSAEEQTPIQTKKRRLESTYASQEECSIEDLKGYTSQEVDRKMLKFANCVERKVVVYDCPSLAATLAHQDGKKQLMAEWSWVLRYGPGCLVLKSAFQDLTTVDAASQAFNEIISIQNKAGGGGDHFAKAGANDRIWNSLEKLCVHSPSIFADYFANAWISSISEAWLGPGYQVSAQVNVIKPGGKAQAPHRDYHLGFQSMETVAKFPLHVQTCVSPMLTLQGAVAHVDVPLESGPTKLLPFSHQYPEGYLAWKREDFKQYFEDNFVQLPLKKGDMLFFNPALLHAGGDNVTSGSTSVNPW